MLRWFRSLGYRDLTQTEARQVLKQASAGLTPPKPTRQGYDTPDGRERRVYTVRVLRSVLRRRA